MPNLQPNHVVQSCVGLMSRLAYARAVHEGVNARDLLRRAGLDVAAIEDPEARLSVTGQISFVELVAEALGDPELGVHLAQEFDLRRLEYLYYVPASADTLGTALQRLERYSGLANEGIVARVRKGRTTHVRFQYTAVARHTDRHQIEFFVTAAIRLCRHLVDRDFKLQAVRLAHHRVGKQIDLERLAGVRIQDDAAVDEIEFPAACLALPIATTDPHLHDMLVRYCEDAVARRRTKRSPLRVRIENAVVPLLPHGQAQADTVAAKLSISPRTLARRLAAEDLAFSTIVRDLRIVLAQRYLADSDLSISQIAWLLGYREVGAFTHAFRRWTGMTPSEARGQTAAPVA
jgi:AraC-like DNA-binding protein